MELNLRDEASTSNGHASSPTSPKRIRAEMAGAVPIPEPGTQRHVENCSDGKSYCGFGACHPLWLQMFATIKWFLATMCAYVLLQSLLVSGYTSSVITTIEKRYDLRSTESGLVVSSFDIGSLLVVVFISYFGGKGHRPRWVGVGAAIVAVGAVVFASPQFFSSPYQPTDSSTSASAHEYLCVTDNSSDTNVTADTPTCEAREASSIYIFLFVIANMIIGIGSTPIYTLGTTFIYDNSPKEESSLYIAIMYLMGAVGPALGYVLGGALISFYVDPWLDGPPVDDPAFIGAWWSGYVMCAGLILLTSFPLLAFPRRLPKRADPQDSNDNPTTGQTPGTPVTPVTMSEDEPTNQDDFSAMDASMNFGKNLKGSESEYRRVQVIESPEMDPDPPGEIQQAYLPKAFLSLLSNGTFLCITITATLEFSIVTAFLTFVPKYLQNQFGIDPSQASIYTGVVLVPSAGGGIMLGGYIVKKLKLNMTGCAKVALLSNVTALALFVSVFLINCPSATIIGVSGEPCAECSCDSSAYEPICFNNITFYNPCKAGCEDVATDPSSNETVYLNCTCSSGDVPGTSGMCERDCTSYFIPFMVCLFLVTMATASAQTPALMVTLRCVKNDERPFAMGLQFVFFRALAYIPAPIYFGSAIDRACIIWRGESDVCEQGSGACQVYDADLFRYIYFGVAVSLKVVACFFVCCSWILCRRQYTRHNHTTKYRKEKRRKFRERYRKKDTEDGYAASTYGSVHGGGGAETTSASLPGLNHTETSDANATNNNANNTQKPRPVSMTGGNALLAPPPINTVSSSESESSVNSGASQKPLIGQKGGSNSRRDRQVHPNAALNVDHLQMDEVNSRVVYGSQYETTDDELMDVAL